MKPLISAIAFSALSLAMAGTAGATDRAEKVGSARAIVAPQGGFSAENFDVEVVADGTTLWSGTLRLSLQYGNASFSQSKNEYAEPCMDGSVVPQASNSANYQLRFNLNRRSSQQQPDLFGINVTWVRPLAACEGQGTNTVGFDRQVMVVRGSRVFVEGEGGLAVRLTRR